MVTRFLPCFVALAGLSLVACSPYPENTPYRPAPAHPKRQGPTVQAQPAGIQTPNEISQPATAAAPIQPAATRPSPAAPVQSAAKPAAREPAPAPQQSDLPVATKAPGKEGYVLSPYNKKLILVRGVPSGTIVPDPASPASDKKYFRVP